MADMRYAHTPKPFGREVTFTLAQRMLTVSDEHRTLSAPLKEITRVRLTYEPRNTMAKGFRLKLWLSNNRTATMTNLAWRSMIQVERLDGPYRAFVIALLDEIGRANPGCDMRGGQPKPVWLLVLAAGIASLVGMVWLIVRSIQAGSSSMALMVLLFGAYFGFTIGDMIWRNRPRTFTAQSIPLDLLPPAPTP